MNLALAKKIIFSLLFIALLVGVSVWFVLNLKRPPAPTTKAVFSKLPDGYTPPQVLTRIDSKVSTGEASPKTVLPNRLTPEQSFNTKDDAGSFFLFGVYKTKSGKILIAGIVQKIEVGKSLKLWLVDGFSDLIEPVVEIAIAEDGSIPVVAKNSGKDLDLSKPVNIVNRNLDSFKNNLVGSRVVVEVDSDYKGKVLYYE